MFLHKTHLPKTQVEWNLKIPYYRKNQNPTKHKTKESTKNKFNPQKQQQIQNQKRNSNLNESPKIK